MKYNIIIVYIEHNGNEKMMTDLTRHPLYHKCDLE